MGSIWETEELARFLCGIEDEDETTDIDEALLEKFEVDLCQFATIITAVLPLCEVARSSLTGLAYRGFGHDGLWLLKQEIVPAEPTILDAG